MRKWLFLPLTLLLFGCGLLPASPGSSSSSQAGSTTVDTPPASTPVKLSSGPFSMTIFSPSDQQVVSVQKINIQGEVSSDAVLTINEDTYVLNTGAFSEPVTLVEGLNSIEIVASDMDGNEVDLVMTITYQP